MYWKDGQHETSKASRKERENEEKGSESISHQHRHTKPKSWSGQAGMATGAGTKKNLNANMPATRKLGEPMQRPNKMDTGKIAVSR